MCRSIKPLRRVDEYAGVDEIEAAALQYVRKVSGFRRPSRGNAEAFDAAVREIGETTRRLLEQLPRARPVRVAAAPAADQPAPG